MYRSSHCCICICISIWASIVAPVRCSQCLCCCSSQCGPSKSSWLPTRKQSINQPITLSSVTQWLWFFVHYGTLSHNVAIRTQSAKRRQSTRQLLQLSHSTNQSVNPSNQPTNQPQQERKKISHSRQRVTSGKPTFSTSPSSPFLQHQPTNHTNAHTNGQIAAFFGATRRSVHTYKSSRPSNIYRNLLPLYISLNRPLRMRHATQHIRSVRTFTCKIQLPRECHSRAMHMNGDKHSNVTV